jgi:FMN hydrolase / 5-amino-6-(5-phospho-D-ribitylamino)uracil phosphatase
MTVSITPPYRARLGRPQGSIENDRCVCYLTDMPEQARPLPRAVLLDYGGTLDGDALHWFDHFAALYAQTGMDVAVETLTRAFYAADDALAHQPGVREFTLEPMVRMHVRMQFAALGVRDTAAERRIADAFIIDTRAAWHRNRPLVSRLAGTFLLGVVSNSYGNMPALLADAALGPFSVIVDSAVVGLRKPDPAIYEYAARRLQLPATTILHVGDSWHRDVVPARMAGMRAAWLARPDAPLPAAAGDVWRITSLVDLEALLA